MYNDAKICCQFIAMTFFHNNHTTIRLLSFLFCLRIHTHFSRKTLSLQRKTETSNNTKKHMLCDCSTPFALIVNLMWWTHLRDIRCIKGLQRIRNIKKNSHKLVIHIQLQSNWKCCSCTHTHTSNNKNIKKYMEIYWFIEQKSKKKKTEK